MACELCCIIWGWLVFSHYSSKILCRHTEYDQETFKLHVTPFFDCWLWFTAAFKLHFSQVNMHLWFIFCCCGTYSLFLNRNCELHSPSPNKMTENATISLPIYFQLPQSHYVCTIFLADTCCSLCQLNNHSNYVSGLALCSLIERQCYDWADGSVAKNLVSTLCFLVWKHTLRPETKKSEDPIHIRVPQTFKGYAQLV